MMHGRRIVDINEVKMVHLHSKWHSDLLHDNIFGIIHSYFLGKRTPGRDDSWNIGFKVGNKPEVADRAT